MTSGGPQPFQSLNVVKTPQTDPGNTLELQWGQSETLMKLVNTPMVFETPRGLRDAIKTPKETISSQGSLFKDFFNFLQNFMIKLSFIDWIFLSVLFFSGVFFVHPFSPHSSVCASLWVCEPVVWGDSSKNVWHHSAESYKSVSPPPAHRYWLVLRWDRTDTSDS